MGQELGLYGQPGVFTLSDRFAEMGSIPLNDDGGEQVEPGHAVALALAGAVADFALTPDAEREAQPVVSQAPRAGALSRCFVSACSISPLSVHPGRRGAVRKGIVQRTAYPSPLPPPHRSQERLI